MAVFTETIKLEDQVSPAAKAAANETRTLTGALDAVNKSLVKAAALGDVGSFQKLTAQAGALKVAIGQVSPELLKEAAAAKAADEANSKAAKGAIKDAAEAEKAKAQATQKTIAHQAKLSNVMASVRDAVGTSVAGMRSAFTSLASGDVKGAVQGVTDSVAGMAKLLDLVVPGLGQAAAVVVQIAGGLVGITAGLIKSGVEFAISSSEAKQEMLGLFDAMGGGITTGAETEAMIDDLKSKFGVAKDSLVGYTNALHQMGMTNLDEIRDSLLAVSSASALVKGGDQALLSFMKKIEIAKESGAGLKVATKQLASLGATGANVGDVAAVMGVSVETLTKNLAAGTVDAGKFGDALQEAIINKGKGPLERMAASSANLKKLLSEAWGDLFEDIDVGPFMQEVKKLFDVFGQGTSSGQALKAGIGGFFKQVFAVLTKVVPLAKHFLLDMVIYGLKAYLAIKPIVAEVKKFAASAEGGAMISAVLSGLWEVLKVVGVALLVVVAAATALWAAMIVVSVAVWSAVGAFLGFVTGAGDALTGWISSAATAAYDFVAGLVNGIAGGASQVIGAVSGLADSATGAFKSALGIASPSKVMMTLGGHTGAGFAQGLDDTSGDVHGAASGVAGAAVKGASSGGEAGGASGGSKAGAQISVTVMIDGAGKSAAEITQELVASVFEQYAMAAGVG